MDESYEDAMMEWVNLLSSVDQKVVGLRYGQGVPQEERDPILCHDRKPART